MFNRTFVLSFAVAVAPVLAGLYLSESVQAQAPTLPPAAGHTVDFAQEIHPLLEARCASCHADGSAKGGFSIDSRDSLLKGSESGPVVVEGKSAESRLVSIVAGLDPDVVMPPKGARLNETEVGLLRAWIDQGLPWTLEASAGEKWEAPLAPRRPKVPAGTAEHPVDRFMEAYFAAHGVTPSAPVSDAAFARRAYLDAIGLLPTPEQLDAFLNDPAPDKRAKLVDALLADRQGYAEHWISFWNDALRNDFQGTGYIDGGREQITAWLYAALYDNVPYNQFVAQLINPNEANDGFVKGIVWRGTVTAAETPAMQAGRSIAQVFLGVNLKCASCHDSFINEWKLADAYGMAGVFTEEPLEMVRCDTPQGEIAPVKFLWPELGAIDPNRPVAGRRAQMARLVTCEENGRFARTIVNRLWAKLLGRGLVEPLDDMAQEPWHADLLDWLASDLVDHGYDLKATLRRIMTSQAYARASMNSDPKEKPYVFRGPEARRLSAEQFLDALGSLTGVWKPDPQFALPQPEANAPDKPLRAWRHNSDPLTRALGRPNREQVTTRRDEQATTLQALEIANGATLAGLLQTASERLYPETPPPAREIALRLFRHALQRDPSEAELAVAAEVLGDPISREGIEDFLWMLVMLPEFQYL
jgi:mono/diheme cytochrome c family protein